MEPDYFLIVLDLEATCWEQKGVHESEIIEIGAVKLNAAGEVLGEFSAFVKPQLHPRLSDFCRELTTITQTEVDRAAGFVEVLRQFRYWIGEGAYVLCSWGFYDKKQLRHDCSLHQQDVTWLRNHISVKHQYARIKQLKRPVGMAAALAMEQLDLIGTHHRGIDDARNIARITQLYLDRWDYPVKL